MASITGTSGNDSLVGSSAADQMYGLEGSDTLLGNAGDDFLDGGTGGDLLNGGTGIDVVSYANSSSAVDVNLNTNLAAGGDAQGDILTAIESLTGSDYADTLTSGLAGTLKGGYGDDVYVVTSASVTVSEALNANTDEIRTTLAAYNLATAGANVENLTYTGTATFTGIGNTLDNVITGGSGNDSLAGGAGADVLFGGAGNDALAGGDGADQLVGGAGNDTVNYDDATGAVTIDLLYGQNVGFAAGDTYTGIEAIRGSNYNDTFITDNNPNSLNGGAGTDVVDYSNANAISVNLNTNVNTGSYAEGDNLTSIEVVVGSVNADTLTSGITSTLKGGYGDDVYVITAAGVTVTEAASADIDEIRTTLAAYSLAAVANVENLTYSGTAAFTGAGNALNNVLTGGTGSDSLSGGAGADVLFGGGGNDALAGGDGADQFFGGAGSDTVNYDDATGAVSIDLLYGQNTGFAAGDTFIGVEAIRGSNYNDTVVSDDNPNGINGGAGTDVVDYSGANAISVNLNTNVNTGSYAEGDTLTSIEVVIGSANSDTLASGIASTLKGGYGDDVYVITGAGVTVTEAASTDTDEIRTALAAYNLATAGVNVENLTYTGAAAFTGTGNALNNVLTGGTGGDSLSGGAGADVLQGGGGNDALAGGDGADQFFGGAGNDTVNYDDATGAVTIDLLYGQNTGFAAGDTFTGVEAVRGSNYNDTFISDDNPNSLNGGAGTDVVDYSGANAISVNLNTNVNTGSYAEGDNLTAIEVVVGSNYADTLTSGIASTLKGGYGDDVYVVTAAGVTIAEAVNGNTDEIRTTLAAYNLATAGVNVENLTYTGAAAFAGTGNALDNVLTGGTGGDSLSGGAGVDVLQGGGGNDALAGGDGADQFFGGAGNDTVNYDDATGAVTIDLLYGQNTGFAAGDTFTGVEAIRGSNYNDTFISDDNPNSINGGAGTDVVDYSGANAISVNLNTNVNTGSYAQGDNLSAIEVVIGSENADTLTSGMTSTLKGGYGDDVYVITGAGVTVTEAANGNTDEIRTTLASYSLAAVANVETLVYTGTAAFAGTGNTLDNVLVGGVGADTLSGGAGADQMSGGGGNDSIAGGDGTDVLFGDAGNDALSGGNGADQFFGGAGSDTVNYDDATGAVTVDLLSGLSTGFAAGDTFDAVEAIRGSNYGDTFISDATPNSLNGGAGNDTVDYSGSNAVSINLNTNVNTGGYAEGDNLTSIEAVTGSDYADTLTSGIISTLKGGYGDDLYVVTGTGVTIAEALNGNTDEVRTTLAAYNLATSAANVENLTYTGTAAFTGTGNAADNVITGGTGADYLAGAAGADQLVGGGGNDVILGGDGADVLSGEAGNDALSGGDGADQFFGGSGSDTVNYDDATGAVTIDLLWGLSTGFAAGDSFTEVEAIRGSNYADTFVSNGAANTLNGGAGTDVVDYSGSNAVNVNLNTNLNTGGYAEGDNLTAIEVVIGSDYADTLTSGVLSTLKGGYGDDVYVVTASGVTVAEATNGNTDEIRTTLAAYTLATAAANVENLTYTGAAAFTGTGNALDNLLTGGAGNDSLSGGAGTDVLAGGAGSDTLLGGDGADQFLGGTGVDYVSYADSSAAVTLDLNAGTGSGFGAGDTFLDIEGFIGTSGGDTFIESADAHNLDGGLGSDQVSYEAATSGIGLNLATGATTGFATGDVLKNIEFLRGSGFDDSITGNSGDNFIAGGSGADQIDGGAGADRATYGRSSAAVRIDLLAGTAAGGDAEGDVLTNIEQLEGSSYNDTLTGNAQANFLFGGEGSDLIDGGDGDDTFYGGLNSAVSADTLYGGNGNDTFTANPGADDGSMIFGDAGNDSIQSWNATVHGGTGNDYVQNFGLTGFLFGDDGLDTFDLHGFSQADGGESGDTYNVNSTNQARIEDSGIVGSDFVKLNFIVNRSDVGILRQGNDLYVSTKADIIDGISNSGVYLPNWYIHKTIELFAAADGITFTI